MRNIKQPTNQTELYFDHSATTRVCEKAAQATLQAMTEDYGNASSLHRKGFRAEQAMTRHKQILAKALGCLAEELLITSGATESNNLALQGVVRQNPRGGKKIITTAIEHPSVKHTLEWLASQGYEVVFLPPDADGHYSPTQFFEAVDANTVLVSAMLVNNETGLILPVAEIAKAVKRKNPRTLMHVDAVQGFLKLPFSVKRTDIDLVSISGHKIFAPKGIGLLYCKKGVRLHPLLFGGHQQNGVRPGTDNTALLAGLAASVETHLPTRDADLAHCKALRKRLVEGLKNIAGAVLNSPADGAPYIVNFSVEGIRSEIMLHFLEEKGIYVSSGSACSKGAKSHVLSAMGLSPARIDSAVRVSLAASNTIEEVDSLLEALSQGSQQILRR